MTGLFIFIHKWQQDLPFAGISTIDPYHKNRPMDLKNYVEIILSIAAIILSILAFVSNKRNAKRITRIENSKTLNDKYESVLKPRKIMKEVIEEWKSKNKIKEDVGSLSPDQRISFIEYYNRNFHHLSVDSPGRKTCEDIMAYINALNSIWSDASVDVFERDEVFRVFGTLINQDAEFIELIVEAHWRGDNEFEKGESERYWRYIPMLLREVKSRRR